MSSLELDSKSAGQELEASAQPSGSQGSLQKYLASNQEELGESDKPLKPPDPLQNDTRGVKVVFQDNVKEQNHSASTTEHLPNDNCGKRVVSQKVHEKQVQPARIEVPLQNGSCEKGVKIPGELEEQDLPLRHEGSQKDEPTRTGIPLQNGSCENGVKTQGKLEDQDLPLRHEGSGQNDASGQKEACQEEWEECILPAEPEEPLASDCCGTGCTPCVFDLYGEELKAWEEECKRIKEGSPPQHAQICNKEAALSKSEYREFTLASITTESKDSSIYRFSLQPGQCLGLQVGQHIILRGKVDGKALTRQYTPISELDAKGYFDVMIKLYAGGRMSEYIRGWKVGDQIEWRGPYGAFTYKPNMYRRVVMLTAGTGIAPMVQVLRQVLENEEEETLVHLVYCCRTYKDLLLKPLLDQWAGYWNFTATLALSQDSPEEVNKIKRYHDKVHHGRLVIEDLKRLVSSVNNTFVLICGTKSFDKDMINFLKKIGFSDDRYYKF